MLEYLKMLLSCIWLHYCILGGQTSVLFMTILNYATYQMALFFNYDIQF